MPLDSISNSIVRIAPKWTDTIKNLLAAKATKKAADADARAADTQVKSLRAALFPAFSGAPSAVCGHYLLTLTQSKASEAALTMMDGSKVKWSDVTAVYIGNKKVPADQVASLYGGRASSQDIEVSAV